MQPYWSTSVFFRVAGRHRQGMGRAGSLLPETPLSKIADGAEVPVVLLAEARQHFVNMRSPQIYWNGSKLLVPAHNRAIQQRHDRPICRHQVQRLDADTSRRHELQLLQELYMPRTTRICFNAVYKVQSDSSKRWFRSTDREV